MPYSIKGFAYVTKDCSDFFTFIESFVIRIFSIPLSKAMPIESSIEARIAGAELGGL